MTNVVAQGVTNDELQRAVIAKLKADTALTAELSSADQVKEDQYSGTVFTYPAVRVDIQRLDARSETEPCDLYVAIFTVRTYAQGAGSAPADSLAGLVRNSLHRQAIGSTVAANLAFRMERILLTGLLAANRTQEHIWMAAAMFQANVYPTSY
jgi:hypothetical protein